MDPLSQAALGAVVAQVAAGRQLGPRAGLYGAAAGALPDVDVFFSLSGDYFDQLRLHRGITHSLFFAPVVGPLLGWLVWRVQRPPTGRNGNLGYWMLALSLALLSHPLLDVLTPYGTQLLQPFSDHRYAINAMPIIDPVYTLILLTGLWLGASRVRRGGTLPNAAGATLLVSTAYLALGWLANEAALDKARAWLPAQTVERLVAYPTIFQLPLRRVVARTPDRDYVAYLSIFGGCAPQWGSAPRNRHDPALTRAQAAVAAGREGAVFHWFTGGFVHARWDPARAGSVLLLSDLRYGVSLDPAESLFQLQAEALPEGGWRVAPVALAGRPAVSALALRDLFAAAFGGACELPQFAGRAGNGSAVVDLMRSMAKEEETSLSGATAMSFL